MKIVLASGKRKRAIARADLRAGSGIVKINNRLLDFYQPRMSMLKLKEPLIIAGDLANKIDININVRGGGISSQADAARVAMGKALVEYSKNDKLKEDFLNYDRNILVSDVRRKEPAKPNRHGQARAKVQKSYR